MRTRNQARRFFAATGVISLLSFFGLASPPLVLAELPDGSGPFGAPRPWEGGMGVGPYSVTNLRTGHLLTVLPIVSWPGTAGGLSFNLYHNSPNDNSGLEVTPTMEKEHDPFDPITEPIWRTSFSSSLKDHDEDIMVFRDDGTVDTFLRDGEVYVPPAGIFDTLIKVPEPGEDGVVYVLTSKHQSVARYNQHGWLLSVSDASGNTITCQYDGGVLVSVTDATKNEGLSRPGRRLEFECDNEGRLEMITDPQYNNGAGREWVLTRSSVNNAFIKLIDPLTHEINIGYDLHGRITSLQDKNGKSTVFHYYDAKLMEVDDPLPLTTDVNFDYLDNGGGTSGTKFTDRKGGIWIYHFDPADNLTSMDDPLTKTWTAAYEATEPQLAHHATSVTNPLNKTWTMVWDEMGNLEESIDPLGHKTSRTYDGLNNLTSITPPADNTGELNEDKTVLIEYEDEFNPTLPTKIIEPSADGVEDEAETIIAYYHEEFLDNPAWTGKIMEVIDPNGVRTSFTYDNYGQPASETENELNNDDANNPTVGMQCEMNVSGFPTVSISWSNAGGIMCSASIFDAGGNGIGASCGCVVHYVPGVPFAPLGSWSNAVSYDGMGRPLSSDRMVEDMSHELTGGGFEQSTRTYGMTYDAVGRPTVATITSNEAGFNHTAPALSITRTHGASYNDSTGSTTYTGPDGEAIIVSTDDCSRTYQVSRTTPAGRAITTTTTYDDAGRVQTVTNGNGTTIAYTYDDAGRLESATHRRGTSGPIFLRQEYDWTPDGLLLMVSEYDSVSPTAGAAEAVIYYDYDNRNRLIGEERVDYGGTGVTPIEYHFEYTYDLGGNRLTKTDVLNDVITHYTYDVGEDNEGGVDGNQHNNRLLYYVVVQMDGQNGEKVEAGWYNYGRAGHVNRFIKWKASDETEGDYLRVHAYAFHYNKAGQLWISVSMRGELGIGEDPDEDPDNNYADLAEQYDLPAGSVLQNVIGVAAMEYRYDGSGRQRYLVRPRTPDENLQPIGGADAGTWHDFVGDNIYSTYGVTFIPEVEEPPAEASLDVENKMSYLAGVGYDDMNMHTPTSQPVYEHGDQIGTIRRLTATDPATPPSAPLAARATYTAFGEVYDQTATPGTDAHVSFRAGYAGAWGYQSGVPDTVTVDATGTYWADGNGDIIAPADPMTELGWLHVGERYYDPACGRFVMRDPIGIGGGLNCYEYCKSNPANIVDPSGLAYLVHWGEGNGIDGHTAIFADDGTYISFVPNCPPFKALLGCTSFSGRTFGDDLRDYGIPHRIVYIPGLDEGAVAATCPIYDSTRWSPDRNCIDSVLDAISRGGGAVPPKPAKVWLPKAFRKAMDRYYPVIH